MIYFLLRAESCRAVCKGAPPMPPCLCVHSTHLLPPTSVHTHTHAMKQHTCTVCFKSLWGGQQAEPPQASPDPGHPVQM